MPHDPRYDVLFAPIRVGPTTFRNRFYAAPQCTGFGVDRPGQQAYHRAMKAAGEFAVVHTEWVAVHIEADEWPAVTGKLWDDQDARNLQLMVEKVHEHGALAGVQLGFGASRTGNFDTRLCSRGASRLPSDAVSFHDCYAMSRREIRELQGFYADAARRAARVGFDVVNVNANEESGIIQQFLRPRINGRTDEYGGSMENRCRFLLETMERIRAAVGDACAVTLRLRVEAPADSSGRPRVGEEIAVVELADDLVDLWDFEVFGTNPLVSNDSPATSRFFPEGHQLPVVAQLRPHTGKPVVNVGRFTHPDVMVAAIESGVVDLIGVARPGIADPFLPAKIKEGRTDDIRECIGCNVCVGRYAQHSFIICTQNPTVGEEYRRAWHPERFSVAKNRKSDVLIVGAGPAGMECARVLAERGMRRIHLVDRETEMGGHLNWVSRLPGLGEWGWVTDYRRIQLGKKKNVAVIPKTELSAQDVLDYGADIVVLATGSRWLGDGFSSATGGTIEGADASLPQVLTPEQIMVEGKPVPGQQVLVYDADGYYVGVSLAERLARDGISVTYLTPFAEVASFMAFTQENDAQCRLLHELGVQTIPAHVVAAIQPGRVTGYRLYEEWKPLVWEADAVVLVTMRAPEDLLYRSIEADPEALAAARVKGLYRIGDCVVPRLIADAVFDGHRLAREIDEADPAVPLPFIRERRTLTWGDADFDRVVTDQGIDWPASSGLREQRI